MLADRDMARFAAEAELWKDLVFLGKALSATGYRESAQEIWAVVAKAAVPAPWGRRASEYLAAPASASRRSSP
jgi:hypothetical protein